MTKVRKIVKLHVYKTVMLQLSKDIGAISYSFHVGWQTKLGYLNLHSLHIFFKGVIDH